MNKRQKSKELFTVLLFLEAILAFSLGVFGNKVAELVHLEPSLILLGAIVLIVLLFLVTLGRIRYESDDNFLSEYTDSSIRGLLLSRITIIFPVALIVGIITGLCCVTFSPGGDRLNAVLFSIWSYEVIAFIVSAVLLYLATSRNRDTTLILSFSTGLSFGISSTILLLRPLENNPVTTFVGWFIALFIASIFINSSTFTVMIENFRKAFETSVNKKPDK